MYKVFFNDRTIFLDDTLPDMTELGKDYVCAFENITDLKPQVRQFLDPDKSGNLYIFHDDKDSLFDTFKRCFVNVAAAGGLVRNVREEVLLIFRRGKWDLPKGKVEERETIEHAALREVEEECGLQGIELGEFLMSTHHVYKQDRDYILKKTDWYSMLYAGTEPLTPQEKEDITEARWMDPSGLDEACSNTYASIKEVLSRCV